MNKLNTFRVLFLLFFSLMLSCEEDPDVIDPDQVGIWKYYTTSNGLTNNDIRVIMQDHNGIIWIGTYGGGVCRYDNGNWSYIRTRNGLLDDTILAIEEDRFGDIWIGAGYGLNILSEGRIYKMDTIFYPNEYVLSLYSDSHGRMWIGTNMEIIKYYYSDFNYLYLLDKGLAPVYSITEDNIGQIWFSTPGGAIAYNYSEDGYYIIDMEEGLYSNNVRHIFQDSWGMLWFAHLESERITRWNGNNFEYINLYNGYAYPNVFSMIEDFNRNIWFTTWNSGLICFDGVVPRTIGVKGGLKEYNIRCSMVDREGNLWFGSNHNGIQIYTPE
jgi:ligand-binding sensor domain-containing protein